MNPNSYPLFVASFLVTRGVDFVSYGRSLVWVQCPLTLAKNGRSYSTISIFHRDGLFAIKRNFPYDSSVH